MSDNIFLMPRSTVGPAEVTPPSSSVFVKEFGRSVTPRHLKRGWPQRHPIACALNHFPEGYPFRCVELGVFEGDHSYEMLTVLEPEMLYLVDMWEDIKVSGEGEDYLEYDQENWDRRYDKVMGIYAQCANVSILRMSGDQASEALPNNLDLVYLDANHSYAAVLNDMIKWFPKVRAGGILSGDDYCREEVQKAVADFLKDHSQYKLQISDNLTQWWFIKGDRE